MQRLRAGAVLHGHRLLEAAAADRRAKRGGLPPRAPLRLRGPGRHREGRRRDGHGGRDCGDAGHRRRPGSAPPHGELCKEPLRGHPFSGDGGLMAHGGAAASDALCPSSCAASSCLGRSRFRRSPPAAACGASTVRRVGGGWTAAPQRGRSWGALVLERRIRCTCRRSRCDAGSGAPGRLGRRSPRCAPIAARPLLSCLAAACG
mmetsp:Transcript_22566/g.64092  ORF Transcript_22566/g.64092 Transcript_22566/m.64092 type:complete len:204 (-) Transcript_22566:23-634(-)